MCEQTGCYVQLRLHALHPLHVGEMDTLDFTGLADQYLFPLDLYTFGTSLQLHNLAKKVFSIFYLVVLATLCYCNASYVPVSQINTH